MPYLFRSRFPVYLDPLRLAARQGEVRAVRGIGEIPSEEATQSLIDLAQTAEPEVALAAAKELSNRLPKPKVSVTSQTFALWGRWDRPERQRLAEAAWRPEFAAKAVEIGSALLSSTNTEAVECGAGILKGIGTVKEAPGVLKALGDALKMPAAQKPRHSGQNYPSDLPDPIDDLLNASVILCSLASKPEKAPTGDAEVLTYFKRLENNHEARPLIWRKLVAAHARDSLFATREAVLGSMPEPLPQSCIKYVWMGLTDGDGGVRAAACEVAGKSGHAAFLNALIKMVATGDAVTIQEAADAAGALGGGVELLKAWASRLADKDETVQSEAVLALMVVFKGPSGGFGKSGSDRCPSMKEAWARFLKTHERELRSGKKFEYESVPRDLFGNWVVSRNGKDWPPQVENQQGPIPPD